MNLELELPEEEKIDTCFICIVIFPEGETCARKAIDTLYDSKLWLTEKIHLYKRFGDSPTFPFGFDYCIIVDGKVMNSSEINL